ncbi:formyltetrahydrofolate deformylase [Rhizobacter sp. J219]|uniref:formyltetrahydrofolate deformylase n=1 Tax=Rhizobacter sp. J219 TaxID=2898430 RepID=UPI002151D825|nr:formyltetrahydrofolate deformylase [Rhizobacter sp. J219]MCR5884409.1 formyltetrahydrofolate deformylase [Rhizobacter sp. J219]
MPSSTAPRSREFVLTLSCRDAKGIVYAVSGLLYQAGCNIVDSQQFGDLPDQSSAHATGLFFMRVHFEAPPHLADTDTLTKLFTSVREQFGMEAQFHSLARKPRLLLMVSQHGHCLNDLLYRWHSGQLDVDIPAVVSNHSVFAELAGRYGIPFHHLPLAAGASAEAKRAQEQQVEALVTQHGIDLVVLARYMQILSPEFCAFLKGRAINIHHSFLPSFKGAKPYYQAHDRGVKLIGATAHYVTPEADEGPILEQDVARVDHSLSAEDFTAVGRDVECMVLARAVRWHVEHRVLLNGQKTVVFH